MVSKVLFWSGFGVAVRLWTLGIQKRPLFKRNMGTIGAYTTYATVGALFGYWLEGVEQKQNSFIDSAKKSLMEKRRRVLEKEEGAEASS